jgi:copper chaperone CopZ
MKRLLFLILFPFLMLCNAIPASAQFQDVMIGVNGLTCSQCSRTVELSIRKLDFVADVDMNLQHTEGKVTFRKNSRPDMDKIAQAVINAGFSVRFLQADFQVDKNVKSEGGCFSYYGDQYVFTDAPKEPLSGQIKFKFLGKKYLPKNEYKKAEQYLDATCGKSIGKVYHIQFLNP